MSAEADFQPAGPGAMLRQAREQQGMSVQDVANGLNLRTRIVELLERDAFDELPPRTFVKGYLKAYARLVGVKDYDVLAALDRSYPEEVPGELKRVSRQGDMREPSDGVGWLKWVLLLLALGAAAWGVMELDLLEGVATSRESPRIEAPVASPAPAGSRVQVQPAPLPPATEEAQSPAPQAPQAQPAAPAAQQPQAAAAPASEPPPVAAAPAPAPAAPPPAGDRLTVQITGESWLEVRAANGERRYVGLAQGPRTLELRGPAPFSVVVGDAAQVSIRLNGQPIALPASPGRVLRVTVPSR